MRAAKVILGFATVAVALLLVLAGMAHHFFDPDQARERIAAEVLKETGRIFSLEGDMALSLFPGLKITMGPGSLGNLSGAGPAGQPFASFQELEVRPKLIPLLRGQPELKSARLHGLVLHLASDEKGNNNWEDPGREASEPVPPFMPAMEITDAAVHYTDKATNQEFSLENLFYSSGPVALSRPFLVRGGFDFQSKDPDMEGFVTHQAGIMMGMEVAGLKVQRGVITLDVKGGSVPGNQVSATIKYGMHYDPMSRTLSVEDIRLEAGSLRAEGSIMAKPRDPAPSFSGKFSVSGFTPAQAREKLGLKLLDPADPLAVKEATARVTLFGKVDKGGSGSLPESIMNSLSGTATVTFSGGESRDFGVADLIRESSAITRAGGLPGPNPLDYGNKGAASQ